MKKVLMLFFVSHSALVSGVQAQESVEGEEALEALEAAISNPSDDSAVQRFIATLVEVPEGSGFYLVEGDILITRGEVPSYLRNRGPAEGEASERAISQELIVNVVNGKYDFLREPEDRNLTFYFDETTFRTPEEAELALESFLAGAASWTSACPECGVSFTPVGDAAEASFTVSFTDDVTGPIARAFFPSYPKDMWRVEIFPAYFSSEMSFDRDGVMKHEIGHILGFRHEHIDDVPGCFSEGGTFKPLTPYTPDSVMHYLCGEGGSFDLALRPSDIEGFRCLYTEGEQCVFVD